jgi:GNAT superfamily N-acetyltransferase
MIERLTPKTVSRALPFIEGQYREHRIEMGGTALSRALRELLRGRGLVLLASERGRDLGVAVVSFTWTVERGGKTCWLDELYVAPEARGRGIGRKLLRRALVESRRAGCVAMELEVVHGHSRAARLYVREGFEKLPRARYSRRT